MDGGRGARVPLDRLRRRPDALPDAGRQAGRAASGGAIMAEPPVRAYRKRRIPARGASG